MNRIGERQRGRPAHAAAIFQKCASLHGLSGALATLSFKCKAFGRWVFFDDALRMHPQSIVEASAYPSSDNLLSLGLPMCVHLITRSAMTPQEQIGHYLSIDMTTRMTGSNQMISRKRREMTLIIVARFGFVAPRILQVAYSMTRANTFKHLNRLTDEGYLRLARTERSPDGRIYVPTLRPTSKMWMRLCSLMGLVSRLKLKTHLRAIRRT